MREVFGRLVNGDEAAGVVKRAQTQLFMILANQNYLFGDDRTTEFFQESQMVGPVPDLKELA